LKIKWSNGKSTYQPSIKLNDMITADEARELYDESVLEYRNRTLNIISLIDFDEVDLVITEKINNLISSTIEGYLTLYSIFNMEDGTKSKYNRVIFNHNDYSFQDMRSFFYKMELSDSYKKLESKYLDLGYEFSTKSKIVENNLHIIFIVIWDQHRGTRGWS